MVVLFGIIWYFVSILFVVTLERLALCCWNFFTFVEIFYIPNSTSFQIFFFQETDIWTTTEKDLQKLNFCAIYCFRWLVCYKNPLVVFFFLIKLVVYLLLEVSNISVYFADHIVEIYWPDFTFYRFYKVDDDNISIFTSIKVQHTWELFSTQL